MALKKKITQEDGVVTEYHRILYVSNVVNSHSSVAVLSLISEKTRNKQLIGKIQEPYQKAITYETTEHDNLTIEEAYSYLKTLKEFEGAEDILDDSERREV